MKKIFSLAVVFCLALTGIVFSSCGRQDVVSSYSFGYEFAPEQTVDEATLGAFELDPQGMVVIYNEMKKTADQFTDASRSCIWKTSSVLPVWRLSAKTQVHTRASSSASTWMTPIPTRK